MRAEKLRCSLLCLLALALPCSRAAELHPGVDGELFWVQDALGKVAGSGRRGATYQGLVQAGLVLHLDRLLGWKGAHLAVNGLYGYGPSLTGRYLRDFQYASNIETYDTLRLNEFWLEQRWLEERFSLRAGLLVADTDFFIAPGAEVFVNSGFATPPTFSANFSAPTFPLTAPGVRLEWKASDALSLRAAAYSGDIGQENSTDRHGGEIAFSSEGGIVVVAEAEHRFGRQEEDVPSGVVKVSGYYASAEVTSLDGRETPGRGLWSASVLWDQTLHRWDEERHLHLFSRVSIAGPGERALAGLEWAAGFAAYGLWAQRPRDVFGIGIVFVRLGEAVTSLDGTPVTAHHETVIETTYRFALGEYLSLQPDLQVIFNPGATAEAATALVLGVRCTVSF